MRILLAGLGFMGRTHAQVFKKLEGVSVVGVVDSRGKPLTSEVEGVFSMDVPVFSDLEEALRIVECDVVDICLPTDLHLSFAAAAFRAGKHVFCEKPVALTLADAELMIELADSAGRELMVGHCIRFWPEYEKLRQVVDSQIHGRLVSLSLGRRTGRPDYTVDGWVDDPRRCMGAALDLHIHDTDFLCSLLGEPFSVSSRGVRESGCWNSIATTYDYGAEGPLVISEGAWNLPRGWGFQMRFSAVFERSSIDFDSRSNPSLVLSTDESGGQQPLNTDFHHDGYHRELDYFFDCLKNNHPVAVSSGREAARSLAVTLAEIESAAAEGRPIQLTQKILFMEESHP